MLHLEAGKEKETVRAGILLISSSVCRYVVKNLCNVSKLEIIICSLRTLNNNIIEYIVSMFID